MRRTVKLHPLAAIVAVAATLAARDAVADQCWAVTDKQADEAAKLLVEKKDVRLFCAPRKDKTATPFTVAQATHVKRDKYDIVVVKDAAGKTEELDLAYTYVRRRPGEDVFVNVASLVGCPAHRVPECIDGSGAVLP